MYNYRHLLSVKKKTVSSTINANIEATTTGEKDRNKNLNLARTYYFRCDQHSSFLRCLGACGRNLHAEKYRVGHIS